MNHYIRTVLCLAFICFCQSVVFSQSSGNDNSNQSDQPVEKIYTAKEITKKAVIVSKPVPEYTLMARENRVTGKVVLRAVFRSTGKVTNVQAIKRLPDGLTEQAIEAARQIKFKPAEKDGRPVSTFMMLEYNFSL
jgi:protein TonB